MNGDRKTAIAVGVLFLTAMASYLPGSEIIASATKGSSFLANLDVGAIQLGVLLEFINSAAVVGIGVLLFPILKKYHEGLALGYAGTRIIEATLLFVSMAAALLLIPLSQQADVTSTAGALAMDWYNLTFQLAMVVLGAGSMFLMYILYKSKLVPRALTVLGVIGYAALFASGWLTIFDVSWAQALYVPGAIFEILFPLWLIGKGFNSSTTASGSAKTDISERQRRLSAE